MLSLDSTNGACFRMLKRSAEYGTSVTAYVSNVEMGMHKERIAASIITNKALNEHSGFEVTIMRTCKTRSLAAHGMAGIENPDIVYTGEHECDGLGYGGTDGIVQSNRVLSYSAVLALIYYLRLAGWAVTDLVNTSYFADTNLVAVEGIYATGGLLKISVSDIILPIISNILEESEQTRQEKYILKILSLQASGSERVRKVLKESLMVSETVSEVYKAGFNGETDDVDILECLGKTFIVDKSKITCISKGLVWEADAVEGIIDNMLIPYELDSKLNVTSNIHVV